MYAYVPKPRRYSFDNGGYACLGATVLSKLAANGGPPMPDLSHLDDGNTRSAPADPIEWARDRVLRIICTEILRKHNELRVINQELAKCHAALERLQSWHAVYS